MNVMFIHVPKTAGTAIEKSLGLVRSRTPGKFKNKFEGSGQHSFGHIDVRKRIRNGTIPDKFYKSAFKFCFCRNPFDRAVSHYFYARQRHPDKFSPSVSFTDFTRTLADYGKMFRLQTYYTDGIEFDFIGRFENLAVDFYHVAATIGVKCRLMKKNATDHKPYWEYYNDESEENIRRFYAKDFEFFTYDNRLLHIF